MHRHLFLVGPSMMLHRKVEAADHGAGTTTDLRLIRMPPPLREASWEQCVALVALIDEIRSKYVLMPERCLLTFAKKKKRELNSDGEYIQAHIRHLEIEELLSEKSKISGKKHTRVVENGETEIKEALTC
jgi:hypothetical protein